MDHINGMAVRQRRWPMVAVAACNSPTILSLAVISETTDNDHHSQNNLQRHFKLELTKTAHRGFQSG